MKNKIIQGDALEVLKTLDDERVVELDNFDREKVSKDFSDSLPL